MTDNMIIADRIFYQCFTFANITFPGNSDKQDSVINAVKQIMDKMIKVVDELNCFKNNLRATQQQSLIAAKQGVSGTSTQDIGKNIENFFTQAKGVLDIFSKQFLKETIGFSGKWDSKKIIDHLESQPSFDKAIVTEVVAFLTKENESWIKTFIDDRNLCHDKNIPLSPMLIRDGKPQLTLKRSNGDMVSDIPGFLKSLYNNIFNLVELMIKYSFCLVNPGYKIVYLSQLRSIFAD